MDRELGQIREILLGKEYEHLLALKDDIHNEEQFRNLVSKVIAEALADREAKDESVAKVLSPTIEDAIFRSIKNDPKKMAALFYPIIGPAIRKSITETLNQMLDNFNQILENSLSPQSLKWRFDAWRTGRSYSELVLLNSLKYQIEQIFLIHKESSLLISHVVAEQVESKDADMVSSMFSAIQDFIEDSFTTSEYDLLDTLRLGELNVVVECGPQVVIAAVVRGREPEHLRSGLRDFLESIHLKKYAELKDFKGDTSSFNKVPEKLQTLLVSQSLSEKKEKKAPWLAVGALAVVLIALSVWFYFDYQRGLKFIDFQQLVEDEPGIVVLEIKEGGEQVHLNLMLDPDARNLEDVLGKELQSLFPYSVKTTPYFSVDQDIVMKRANRVLLPELETFMTLRGAQLIVSGRATDEWSSRLALIWPAVLGVESILTDDLTIYSARLERINIILDRIVSFDLGFDTAKVEIDAQSSDIQELAEMINQLASLEDNYSGHKPTFNLIGFTDDTGVASKNRKIGLLRAENLKHSLVVLGVQESLLKSFSNLDYPELEEIAARKVRVIVKMDNQYD